MSIESNHKKCSNELVSSKIFGSNVSNMKIPVKWTKEKKTSKDCLISLKNICNQWKYAIMIGLQSLSNVVPWTALNKCDASREISKWPISWFLLQIQTQPTLSGPGLLTNYFCFFRFDFPKESVHPSCIWACTDAYRFPGMTIYPAWIQMVPSIRIEISSRKVIEVFLWIAP